MVPVQEGWVDTINPVVRIIKGAATDSMALDSVEATTAATTLAEDGVVITGTEVIGSTQRRSNGTGF